MLLSNLTEATLIQRYKRFLADVRMPDGEEITVHCPNPGSMLGINTPGMKVLLHKSPNAGRKLPWTLQFVETENSLVLVESALANKLFHEAFAKGDVFSGLGHLRHARPEHQFKDSRFDFILTSDELPPRSKGSDKGSSKGSGKSVTPPPAIVNPSSKSHCLVEVKSTTYLDDDVALFPDARTERGRKHLRTLGEALGEGFAALQFYLVARSDARVFRPADAIDRDYGLALREASRQGVGILAHALAFERRAVGPSLVDLELSVGPSLPIELS